MHKSAMPKLRRRKRLSDSTRMRKVIPSAFYCVHDSAVNVLGLSGSLVLVHVSLVYRRKRVHFVTVYKPPASLEQVRLDRQPWRASQQAKKS